MSAIIYLRRYLDYRCEDGLQKMRDVLLFFADFLQTITASTHFAMLKNMEKADFKT